MFFEQCHTAERLSHWQWTTYMSPVDDIYQILELFFFVANISFLLKHDLASQWWWFFKRRFHSCVIFSVCVVLNGIISSWCNSEWFKVNKVPNDGGSFEGWSHKIFVSEPGAFLYMEPRQYWFWLKRTLGVGWWSPLRAPIFLSGSSGTYSCRFFSLHPWGPKCTPLWDPECSLLFLIRKMELILKINLLSLNPLYLLSLVGMHSFLHISCLSAITIGLAQQALLHAGNARDVLLAADATKQQGRQLYERSDVLPIMELIYLIMGQAHLALKK